MANKTFVDFSKKTALAGTDYIVGYKADGTAEYRTTLNDLAFFLKDYFVSNPTAIFYYSIPSAGGTYDIPLAESAYIIVDTNVSTFNFTFNGINGATFTNVYTPTNLATCKLLVSTTASVSTNKPTEIFVTETATFSTVNNELFTFYYYNTGSLVVGISPASTALPAPAFIPDKTLIPNLSTLAGPTPTPTPTATPTETPTPTPTKTPTNTPTPTETPTPTPTKTPTPTPTPSLNLLNPGLLNSLQAFYKLDNTTDASGNGNTLTNNNNVTFTSGKIGNAANLQGNQTLSTQILSITNGSSGSYSCWVNRNGISEFPLCLINAFGTSVYADSYTGQHADGRLNSYIPSLGEYSVNLNSTDWVHFVLSYDSTTQQVKLYANGQQYHTGTTSSAFGNSNFVIGAGDGQNGKGLVDAVGIWNRALTESEVTELYNSGSGLE